MLIVNHRVTVGGTAHSSGRSRLVGLRTRAALSTPVNSAWIALAPPAGVTVAPDDPVSVELGYGDDLKTVFTGTVETVDWSIGQVAFRAAGAARALVNARLNRFFEKSTAGDIVTDLAGLLDVVTGSVEPGLEFQAYAFSDGVTPWDGLRQLAERCGFDLYSDVEDQLVFARYVPAATHPFQFGVNVLSLRVDRPAETITGAEVYGESPSSFGQGQEAYSWLTKKDVKGTAGGKSGIVARRFDPAVRTAEDAGRVAQAVLAALSSRRACTLKALGAPEVRLGDAVTISRMPQDDQNGTFKVTGVAHRLDVRTGFSSLIEGVDG